MRRITVYASLAGAALLALLSAACRGGRLPPEDALMGYRLEGAYMPCRFIALEVTGGGEAALRYEPSAGGGTETVRFSVPGDRVRELYALYRKARFLRLTEDAVEAPETPTDTGTTTLTLCLGEASRSLSYRFTENRSVRELAGYFQQLAQPHLPPAGGE